MEDPPLPQGSDPMEHTQPAAPSIPQMDDQDLPSTGQSPGPHDPSSTLPLDDTNLAEMDTDVLTLDTEGKSGSDAADAPQISAPRYTAKDLISPRAKRHRDALIDQDTTATDEPEVGMSSMISKLHNVADRESRPEPKRQKLDDGAKVKAASRKSGNGNILQDHLDDVHKDEPQAGPSQTIDLTAEDDADVEIIGAQDPSREVCLGIISARVMAHRLPAANKHLAKHAELWPATKMTLRPMIGQDKKFAALDAKGNDFGRLDNITAEAFMPLMRVQHVNKLRFISHLKARKRNPDEDEQPLQPTSKLLDISVTLLAAFYAVKGIGRYLSQRSIFLNTPTIVPPGIELCNPHVPNYKVVPAKGNASASLLPQTTGFKARTTEEMRADVSRMFDRLGKTEDMPEMEAEQSLVLTDLMPHQKQALWFLTQHEDPMSPEENPLWESSIRKDGTKAWYNVITGDELKDLQSTQIKGGLLADEMGLGKTLSVLSLICSLGDEATRFGDSNPQAGVDVDRNAKTTLLVCPKSVLSNWDEQIKVHLHKKVKFYLYHGSNREQDADELAKNDIIITSYSIVASELASSSEKYSALRRINWFRIVLDEAHMIRNQGTRVFKATCNLLSKRRWAVTGTPVQNRLDDLGALVKFLKVYPFYEKGVFEKYFIASFKSGNTEDWENNLHLLIKSITLRRSKEKIDLPDRKEEIVRLEFSPDEKALYDAFAKDANRKVKAMTQGRDRLRGRSYAHVLVNITRLRNICAHGKEMLSEDDMRTLQGTTYETAIDLGDESDAEAPVMTEEQIYDTFYLLRESTMDICTCCTAAIGKASESPDDDSSSDSDEEDASDVIGYLTPCLHLVCPRCADGFWQGCLESRTKDNYVTCVQCEQYIKAVLAPVTQKGVDTDMERRLNKKGRVATKKGIDYGGPHTKVKALVSDLQQYAEESKGLAQIGEPPIRSVVFSSWTSYLDLIEIALKKEGINFLRLDGKMSVSARTKVMDQFKTDPSMAVILVSIKAGGQGLNFTAANKVFMMEPQFNPGVEMQAVDRVHRLGQKRDVLIRRFIMAASFEEKIIELQKKKIKLANLATGTKTKKQDSKEIFQNLMSLF